VLAVQMLHGLNFGIMGTIAVAFVNDVAEAMGAQTSRGALQARLGASSGLAIAISPIVCGQIAQRFGIGAMFAAMALVGAAGAWVFLTQVRESHPGAVSPAERGPHRLRPVLRWLVGNG
jgi:MFS family permease